MVGSSSVHSTQDISSTLPNSYGCYGNQTPHMLLSATEVTFSGFALYFKHMLVREEEKKKSLALDHSWEWKN